MGRSIRRRSVAAGALALASGTLMATVGGVAPAGASPSSAPSFYSGATHGNVLGVTINIPDALPKLPGLPNPIGLGLISVDGQATHNALTTGPADTSHAVAGLASGTLVDGPNAPLAALGLNKKVTADRSNPSPAAAGSTKVQLGQVADLDLQLLNALVTTATDANNSHARLASGTVLKLGNLLDLSQLNAITAQLKQVDVSGQVDNVVSQLQGVLDPVIKQDPTGQVGSVAGQVLQAVQGVAATVGKLTANVADTAVLQLDTLDATQSIGPAANAARAEAAVNLLKLDLLNGMFTVKGFQSGATALANGRPGGATASFTGHEPIAQLGTPLLTATIDEHGVNLSEVTGLPADVTKQVNDLLAQLQSALTGLLTTLGVDFQFVPGHVDSVAADGTSSAATGPSYRITLMNKALANKPVVQVGLGEGTHASVSAKQVTVAKRPPALAYTGANLPLLGGIGVALLLAAALLRRRLSG